MTVASAEASVGSSSTETAPSKDLHVSKTTLFIRNLPFDCGNEALEAFFSEFGPLRGAFTVRSPEDPSKSKGIGFVHFAMAEDASRVMSEIEAGKVKFAGRKLAADWAQRRADAAPVVPAVKKPLTSKKERDTLPVKPELMENCLELALRFEGKLEAFGPALLLRLKRFAPVAAIAAVAEDDRRALLTFKKPEHCRRLYRKLFGHLNENLFAAESGKSLVLAGVRPVLPEPIKAFRLIIRNLPFSISRPTQLTEHLEPFGHVLEVNIPTVENERSSRGDKDALRGKGFAFVQYASRGEAEKALQGLNGSIIKSRPVAVDWSIPKNQFESADVEDDGAQSVIDADDSNDHLSFSIDTKPSRVDANDEIVDIEGESEIDIEGNSASDAESDAESDGGSDQESVASVVDDHADDTHDNIDLLPTSDQGNSTVFIRNLSFTTEEDDLEAFLHSRFPSCTIEYCKVVRHPDTGASKGSAFVKFVKAAEAAEVIRVASEASSSASMLPADGLTNLAEKRTKRGFQSLVSDADALPTGGLVLDGRILNCTLAVDRTEAAELGRRRALEKISALLSEEGRDRILDTLFVVPLEKISRDKPFEGQADSSIPRLKRNLALINESLPCDTDGYLNPGELKARELVIQNRAKASSNNPNLVVSPCRLAVHHLPPRVTEAQLKEVMYAGVREAREAALKPGNPYRLTPAQLKLLVQFGEASKVVAGLHQVKIIAHRSKRGASVADATSGVKSRGYGFVQWRHPLMALLCVRHFRQALVWPRTEISKMIESRARALAREFPDDPEALISTPVVEFATEKLNVLKKRSSGKMGAGASGRMGASTSARTGRVSSSKAFSKPSSGSFKKSKIDSTGKAKK